MEKVYIVVKTYEYEGSNVYGIFSTEEKAKECLDRVTICSCSEKYISEVIIDKEDKIEL